MKRLLLLSCVFASGAHAAPIAPEHLPPVTVRWEDAAQQAIFIVEGARYQCRVATHPARVLSLRVDGKEMLGAKGLQFALEGADGARLDVAPTDVVPAWQVWRGQNWAPASSSRARMNVWNAGPFYSDAHLLDVPFFSAADVQKTRGTAGGTPLQSFDFAKDNAGFAALHNTELLRGADGTMRVKLTGDDPYIQSPKLDHEGPLTLSLRMKQSNGGGGAFYWDSGTGYNGKNQVTFITSGDGQWHDYIIAINEPGRVKQLRFDPPGETGDVDIQSLKIFRAEKGVRPQPTRGEIVFHAFPDKLHIEVRAAAPEGKAAPKSALILWDNAPKSAAGNMVSMLSQGDTQLALLSPPGSAANGNTWRATLQNGSTYLVAKPLPQGVAPQAAFADETNPLRPGAVQLGGGRWLGYDAASGLYTARYEAEKSAFSFEASYRNPTRRMELNLALQNDAQPRDILIKAQTGMGNLEAGVLADNFGFPTGDLAWVAKNFAGEREEPDDSGYGDIYVPLRLAANERRENKLFALFQNWGDSPLKQVSSIRFFNIYWHLSTGASETTCYTHNWMAAGKHIFQIPDFRPYSGPFWAGQPQHGCEQWPGFLQYNDGVGKLIYERTIFESISPKLARFALLFHASDDSATARVDWMEIPQRDESRTFLKLRYDWKKPVAIEGDARLNFRWLNMAEKNLPAQLVWCNAEGKTQTKTIEKSDAPLLLGEPLAAQAPFAGSAGRGAEYSSVVQVLRLSGRLGGQPFSQAALSARYAGKGAAQNAYWLTVPQQKLTLQPGDFLEAELYLMPHGEPSPAETKPERERRTYAVNGPKTSVALGTKLGDFPARVKAQNDAAAFGIEGGTGEMPLIAEGFAPVNGGPGAPLLWQNGIWQNQQAHGGDYCQIEGDGAGGYRFVFVTPHREGQKHDFVVTRASAPGGIASLQDRNGRLEITSGGGPITLQAPAFFGPGKNTRRAGSALNSFSSSATRAVQLPLEMTDGSAEIIVSEWSPKRIALQTSAAATLTLRELTPGAQNLKINGAMQTPVAPNGELKLELQGAAMIEIAR